MNTPANPLTRDQKRPADESPPRGNRGSLRSKLVLSLGAMFLVFLVVDEVVRQRVINPSFMLLEEAGAVRDADRVLAAINVEAEYLTEISEQLAARIDPAEMTIAGVDEAIEPHDHRHQSRTQKLAWLAVVGTDASWRWLHKSTALAALRESELESPVVDELVRDAGTATFNGRLRFGNHGLFMFAGAPVNAVQAETKYFLVAGRAFDADMIRAISKRTQVDFSLQLTRQNREPKPYDVWEADRSTLVVETPLRGVAGEPLANVFVQVPRDITMRTGSTNTLARNSFVFGAIAALLFLLLLLQRIVVGPIEAIREHTERITAQGLDSSRLVLANNDEVGELAIAFDRMMLRLSETQQKLADASHAAGMSQVADTVIHNVGNVLTNINSLIETATDRVQRLRIQPLEKLAKRLENPDADEELRVATPAYLQRLAATLTQDQDELSELLSTLSDNVSHIHDVIRDQRRHAVSTINKTNCSVNEILTEAIACCQARLDQDRIVVTVPAGDDVQVESDRSLLLQIVINIIGNARHAISENPGDASSLTISIEKSADKVRVLFRDTGCGMSEETLNRVFEAHFTTRPSGSGLGLHFCAIAMNRLGGSIAAESAGPGTGSTFVLELPRSNATSILANTFSSEPVAAMIGSTI
jgi:signal transduction histidine kinase